MNKRVFKMIRSMAVAIAFSGGMFLCGPMMTAKTVHAESCMHENYEWVTMVKPTCSKYGKMVSICQDCEEILETETIEKTEHKCKWEKTREATCTTAGIKSYVCKNCNEVIETEEIPMKSHKFVRISAKAATCQSPRIAQKECSMCGLVTTEQTGDKLEHRYKWKVTKTATCTAAGVKTGTCSMCGITKTESILPTGKHKYGNWALKLIKSKARIIKVTQARTCKVCKKNTQTADGTVTTFSGKHTHNKFFYKFTKSSGRVVILCPECHKSVTGKVNGGEIQFSKLKKDNSRVTSKGWKEIKK